MYTITDVRATEHAEVIRLDWIRAIAEEKIQEAIKNGELDHLPGKGKPLQLDDDSMVPEDLRASFRLLKNAGILPEEMQLRKEMVRLKDLLGCCKDEKEKARLQSEMSAKKLRYQQLMAERGWLGMSAFDEYEDKMSRKLTER
jgi:hypothetical protein